MNKIQGTNLLLGRQTESGFSSFAFAKGCEISQKSDTIEVCSPDSPRAKEYIPGRTSWTATCECLYSSDESVIESLYASGEIFSVVCRQRDNQGYRYEGKAFISSLRLNGRLHEMATYTIMLQGTGDLRYISG